MADLAGSVIGIVAFGLKLGTTIQTYVELATEAEEALRDVVFDINSTASVLRQIHEMLNDSQHAPERHTRLNGIRPDILQLAQECERVYKRLILHIHKARGDSKEKAAVGVIGPQLIELPLSAWEKLKWPFLRPQVERCRDQLRRLDVKLLMVLVVANTLMQYHELDEAAKLTLKETDERFRHRQKDIAQKILQGERENKGKKRASVSNSPRSSVVMPVGRALKSSSQILAAMTIPPPPGAAAAAVPQLAAFNISSETTSPLRLQTRTLPTTLQKESSISRPATAGANADVEQTLLSGVAASDMFDAAGIYTVNAVLPSSQIQEEQPIQEELFFNAAAGPPSEKASTPANIEVRTAPDPTANTRSDPSPPAPNVARRFFCIDFRKLFRDSGASPDVSDFPSSEFEAWMTGTVESSASAPTKLPFGHRQLQRRLNKLEKKKALYTTMDAEQRALVDKTIHVARLHSPHVRTFLTVEQERKLKRLSTYIVYFSLGEPPLPLWFIDPNAYPHDLHFERVKIWEDMKALIDDMFSSTYQGGIDGLYELRYGDTMLPLLPRLWNSTVYPGIRVGMFWKFGTPVWKSAGPPFSAASPARSTAMADEPFGMDTSSVLWFESAFPPPRICTPSGFFPIMADEPCGMATSPMGSFDLSFLPRRSYTPSGFCPTPPLPPTPVKMPAEFWLQESEATSLPPLPDSRPETPLHADETPLRTLTRGLSGSSPRHLPSVDSLPPVFAGYHDIDFAATVAAGLQGSRWDAEYPAYDPNAKFPVYVPPEDGVEPAITLDSIHVPNAESEAGPSHLDFDFDSFIHSGEEEELWGFDLNLSEISREAEGNGEGILDMLSKYASVGDL
ncbi:hypothetical protein QBC44DRAFT_359758 [Cladorrhinum sp. PSN332]|nr:hypothetical protein QBC44DRAFT_359758 [Cladorrhinum sp. PSN332]